MRRAAAVVISLFCLGIALAQVTPMTIHHDGFDGPGVQWSKTGANIQFREDLHTLTRQSAHSEPMSEYLRLTINDPGGQLNPQVPYRYAVPPAPVGDETAASIWVRASRPGVQFYCRVVLPKERDPADLNSPLTVILQGDRYELGGGRWQRLELRRIPKLLKEEQQRLRTKLQRDINLAEATVDQLLLNVYTGPGPIEVWIDDLEFGPVAENKTTPGSTVARTKEIDRAPPVPVKAPAAVDFNRDQLRVGGKTFLFRAMRYTQGPLAPWKEAGINTVVAPAPVSAALADEASKLGMYLAPSLAPDGGDLIAAARDSTTLADDNVLFYHLGDWRTAEELDMLGKAATALRAADSQRPIAADVRDGFWSASRQVDLLGAHRWPLMTSMELSAYRDWLAQRRILARPGTFMWTWIQTHLPDWYLQVVQPARTATGFSEPVGPQSEQIRLLTYLSIAAGSRGIGYWSDQYLSDSHNGRDRLLTIAMLNMELAMLEPMLAHAIDQPTWIETSVPQVKAAVFTCPPRGVLVIPMWLGEGAQYVPGQSATNHLTITVPMVPQGTTAWEVTPGDVRSLPTKRVVGGVEITLTEFDQSTAIAFTGDHAPTGLLVRWQDQCRRQVKQAADYSYELARAEMAKVERVQSQLEELKTALPDAGRLLQLTRDKLTASKTAWDAADYRLAYREAQRSLRPLRILMRSQWEQLVKGLDSPVASAYAVSYYTLPKHVQFVRELATMTPKSTGLTGGDFEQDIPGDWSVYRTTLDEVDMEARVSNDEPQEGRKCLKLCVKPRLVPQPGKNGTSKPPEALERTLLAVQSPAVKLPAGSLVRVSAWVRTDGPITASADGAVIFDTAGGEPLGVRFTQSVPQWKKYTLYRKVPASGTIQMTLALTGLGTVYFDDVRIEALEGK